MWCVNTIETRLLGSRFACRSSTVNKQPQNTVVSRDAARATICRGYPSLVGGLTPPTTWGRSDDNQEWATLIRFAILSIPSGAHEDSSGAKTHSRRVIVPAHLAAAVVLLIPESRLVRARIGGGILVDVKFVTADDDDLFAPVAGDIRHI